MDKNLHYLEFLRYCLDETTSPPACVEDIDWDDLYMFARHQTAEATFWEGIDRLDHSGGMKLSETSVLRWMARKKKIEKDNQKVYKKAAWVWKNFLHEGFRSCLLKGQGNALL